MNSLNYCTSFYNNYIFNRIPTNIINSQYNIENISDIQNQNFSNIIQINNKINNKSNTSFINSNYDNFQKTNKHVLLKRNKSQGKISIKKSTKNNLDKFKTIGERINKKCNSPEIKKLKEQKTIDYSNILENNNIYKKYNLKKGITNRPKTPDYNSYNSTSSNSNNRKNSKQKRQKTPEKILNKIRFNLNNNYIGNNFEKKSPLKRNNKNRNNHTLIHNKYKNNNSSNEKYYSSNNKNKQNTNNENNVKNLKNHKRNVSGLINNNNYCINQSNSKKKTYTKKKNTNEVNNFIKSNYNISNHETPHFNNLNIVKNIINHKNNLIKNTNNILYTNIGINENIGEFYQSFGNMISVNSKEKNLTTRNNNKLNNNNSCLSDNNYDKYFSQKNILSRKECNLKNTTKNSKQTYKNSFKTNKTSKDTKIKSNNKNLKTKNSKKKIVTSPQVSKPLNLNIQNINHMYSNTQNIPINNYKNNSLFSMSLNSNKNIDDSQELEKIDFNEFDKFSPPFQKQNKINVKNYNENFYSPQINEYTNIEIARNNNSNNKQIINDFLKKISDKYSNY